MLLLCIFKYYIKKEEKTHHFRSIVAITAFILLLPYAYFFAMHDAIRMWLSKQSRNIIGDTIWKSILLFCCFCYKIKAMLKVVLYYSHKLESQLISQITSFFLFFWPFISFHSDVNLPSIFIFFLKLRQSF